MTDNKYGTVALCICADPAEGTTNGNELIEALSDDQEISLLERAISQGDDDPLALVHQLRAKRAREEEEFGNYVEDLLSEPFLKPTIQEQAVQWLRSKMKIEDFQKSECEATQVIADYAFQVFRENPNREEFVLAGSSAAVKIRVFRLPKPAGSGYSIAS